MKERIIEGKGENVKLGNSTEKAQLYVDYLVNSINKGKGISFLEVNEKGEIILHRQKTE